MNWKHILDEHPDDNSYIIKVAYSDLEIMKCFDSRRYKNFEMSIYHFVHDTEFKNNQIPEARSWKDFIETLKIQNKICRYFYHLPDFWWIYAKDFPFPFIKTQELEKQ